VKTEQPRPCHIVADPRDNRSLCGVKDPMPVVAQKAAILHRYPMARCLPCYAAAGLAVLFDLLPANA
jgi:hypothetical protein